MAAYLNWRTALDHPSPDHSPAWCVQPAESRGTSFVRFGHPGQVHVHAQGLPGHPCYGLIGNKAPYSRISEWGCVIEGSDRMLSWFDSAGRWRHWGVVHMAHPFMEPATEEAIDKGDILG